MTKEQALNMLKLIADLYKILQTPDAAPEMTVPQAPEAAAANGKSQPRRSPASATAE